MGVLSNRALNGLKAYQYKSSGFTYLDEIHQAPWNYAVSRMPLWLAPNLITLSGTACILLAYILNALYLPNFEGEAPRWLYFLTSACVAIYVNLDCIDGKQARRTGSSSPLGQLFDHGCDAVVLHMLLANIAVSLQLPCGWKMAAGSMAIMAPWLLAQWEEYHTGIMVYGTRYYGVLEANYAICALHLVNACFGAATWRRVLSFGLPGAVISVGDLSLALVMLAGVAQGFQSFMRVVTHYQRRVAMPPGESGNKQLGPGHAWVHLASLATALALGSAWITLSEGRGIAQCRVTFSAFGLLYALLASQVILAHMSKEPYTPSLLIMSCLVIGVADNVFRVWDPLLVAAALHVVAAVAYTLYVTRVVREICAFLGIRCLTIPVLKAKGAQ